MNKEEQEEFISLGTRMFELYHKAPQSDSKRKIMGAYDDKGWNYNMMFFQGNKEDMLKVQEFLNKLPK